MPDMYYLYNCGFSEALLSSIVWTLRGVLWNYSYMGVRCTDWDVGKDYENFLNHFDISLDDSKRDCRLNSNISNSVFIFAFKYRKYCGISYPRTKREFEIL